MPPAPEIGRQAETSDWSRNKTGSEAAVQRRFFITGIVRDAEKTLAGSVSAIDTAFRQFGTTRWFVVESDSSDRTPERLAELASTMDDFSFVTLGVLQSRFAERIDRIAFCRNSYLQHFFDNGHDEESDFLVVADLDGMNQKLDGPALASCWEHDSWDACFANQDGPYYDIYALRHPVWSATDPQVAIGFFRRFGLPPSRSVNLAVYDKMIRIPRNAEWIEVESAFGGLGIYRPQALREKRYHGRDAAGAVICEHVMLHQQMRQAGCRLFINPGLVNDSITEHTRHASLFGAVRHRLRQLVMDGLFLFFGKKIYRLARNSLAAPNPR